MFKNYSKSTYLLKLVDLSNKEISIATGNLGVCNMNHILVEDQVNSLLEWLASKKKNLQPTKYYIKNKKATGIMNMVTLYLISEIKVFNLAV